jgi:hypothetical protein
MIPLMVRGDPLNESSLKRPPFWKSRQVKIVPKSNFSIKFGTETCQERIQGAFLKRHGKNEIALGK